MGQVVNLRWASHKQHLVAGIWNLFQEKYKTDFDVSLNGSYISTHQIMMSIFCSTIKNSTNNTLILGEKASVTKEDLNSVLEFLYCGEVKVNASRLHAIMSLSNQLGFKVLSQLTSQSLKMVKRKCLGISKQEKKQPMVVKAMASKSKQHDCVIKTRSTAKNSISGKEVFKQPSKNRVTVKDPNLSKSPSKSTENASDAESSVAAKNSNILIATTEGDVSKAVQNPYWMEPQCRDELCLESFNPHTFEFNCKHCKRGFAKVKDLYNHLQVHEQPKMLYECQHCEYKTNTRSNFSGHMINRHQMDLKGNLLPKDLKCPHCPYVCCANFQLKNHIYVVHSTKRKVCDMCGYRCQNKSGLDKHKLLVHSNDKPLMCETCGHRSKNFVNLRRHMRVHFCSKVACDICGANVSFSHLPIHKKMKHSSDPRPFTCHLCKFSSWKSWNLKVHLRSVHQVEPNSQKMHLI